MCNPNPRAAGQAHRHMPDEKAWAWVGDVVANYKRWEKGALKQTVASVRLAQARIEDARATAISTAQQAVVSVEAGCAKTAEQAQETAKGHFRAFPEAVVGGGAVLASGLIGVGPRRFMLAVLAIGVGMRQPLSVKYGDNVAEASATLSTMLRESAEAAGMLSTPK